MNNLGNNENQSKWLFRKPKNLLVHLEDNFMMNNNKNTNNLVDHLKQTKIVENNDNSNKLENEKLTLDNIFKKENGIFIKKIFFPSTYNTKNIIKQIKN